MLTIFIECKCIVTSKTLSSNHSHSFEDEIKMPNGAPAVLLEIRKPSGLILTIESDRNSEKAE